MAEPPIGLSLFYARSLELFDEVRIRLSEPWAYAMISQGRNTAFFEVSWKYWRHVLSFGLRMQVRGLPSHAL
jgi:hypothetical protein